MSSLDFEQADFKKLQGMGRMDSLEMILKKGTGERDGSMNGRTDAQSDISPRFSQAKKAALAERKNQMYRSFLADMTPAAVAPSTRKVLEELRERGYLLAVGSSSRNTKYIMEKTNEKYEKGSGLQASAGADDNAVLMKNGHEISCAS